MRKQVRTAAVRTCASFRKSIDVSFRNQGGAVSARCRQSRIRFRSSSKLKCGGLRLLQSLRNVCEEIRRMLDADRETDRRVENAYLLPDGSRNA